MIEDVTEITEAEKTLEAKTIELETMSENLISGILITTMEEGFPVIRCNKGYQEMTGRSEEQIVGKCAMQWVIPEDSAKLNKKIQIQFAEKNSVSIEHRLHASNGKEFWVELRGKRTVLRNQQVGVWILTDISKAKKVELDLKVEEERYRIAMQSTENISEYIVRILYESSDSNHAIGAILELLSKHFGFNRGYIFEYVDSGWCTTYQWSDKEKENAIENLLKFPWQVLQNNGNEFDENGIFAISRSNLPDEKAQMFLKNIKVKSLIWFSAMNNGILQAVIGFDHVIDEREIEQKDILILRHVSMLLGIFLMNSRESK